MVCFRRNFIVKKLTHDSWMNLSFFFQNDLNKWLKPWKEDSLVNYKKYRKKKQTINFELELPPR